MLDGFEPLCDRDLQQGTCLNLNPYVNKFSPFSDVDLSPCADSQAFWTDRFYGLVYSRWIEQAHGVYGITNILPRMPYDDNADRGFLRVPFARIPRLTVGSAEELRAIVTEIASRLAPGQELLFRGQPREYLLGRSRETRHALFGDADALEPSLTTSATRRGTDINGIMPGWMAFLHWITLGIVETDLDEELEVNLHFCLQHYNFSRFALSMAQHYGLPSSGLDVTDSLEVALFFATRMFIPSRDGTGRAIYAEKSGWSEPSVIYLLVVPSAGHRISFEETGLPLEISNTRPARQRAFFMHRGWGLNANDCATHIALACYFDTPLECRATASGLFPSRSEDPFAAALEDARRGARKLPATLAAFLNHYYWVATGEAHKQEASRTRCP